MFDGLIIKSISNENVSNGWNQNRYQNNCTSHTVYRTNQNQAKQQQTQINTRTKFFIGILIFHSKWEPTLFNKQLGLILLWMKERKTCEESNQPTTIKEDLLYNYRGWDKKNVHPVLCARLSGIVLVLVDVSFYMKQQSQKCRYSHAASQIQHLQVFSLH